MDKTTNAPARKSFGQNRSLTAGKAGSILWETAWEALVLAFLVWVLGQVAVAMVGGLFNQMMPSWPPGLAVESSGTSQAASGIQFSPRQRFGLIFGVVFVGMAAGRLMRYSPNKQHRNTVAGLQRIGRRLSDEWFGLVVLNAIIASVTASVVQITSQFTMMKLLWGAIGGLIQPMIHAGGNLLPESWYAAIKDLIGWFNANQLKFTFWLLYGAAICDDLGLPNYKTLCRFLRRRLTRTNKPPRPSQHAMDRASPDLKAQDGLQGDADVEGMSSCASNDGAHGQSANLQADCPQRDNRSHST